MDTLYSQIIEIFNQNGIDLTNIDENTSLIESGIIDSMMFVNILLEIEEKYNVEIDFENIEMSSITTIKGLCNHIDSIK